jgi:preprotein translocase subunit SecF
MSGSRPGALSRLVAGRTQIDFIGWRRRAFITTAAVLLVAILSLLARGLNLGIDFEGGVVWEVPSGQMTVEDARGVLDANGLDGSSAKVQTLSGGGEDRIRVQVADQTDQIRIDVRQALADAAAVPIDEVSVESVSASWGRSITEKAIRALVVFFVILTVFIAWRFEWKMAVAALAAIAHDVLVTVGVYSLIGFEVSPATVVAFLTILGYSLYDTIVVFDKVRETDERFSGSRVPYADGVNVALNQVLFRSINTTVTTLVPVVSLLIVGSQIMGAIALRDFAVALTIGLLAGTYSSIVVAAPLLSVLKEREPRYRSLRGTHATGDALGALMAGGPGALKHEKIRSTRRSAPARAGSERSDDVDTSQDSDVSTPAAPTGPRDATAVLTHPPRPRKKRRR